MRKTVFYLTVVMLSVLASTASAGDKGEGMLGRLFLFQKCDPALAPDPANPLPEGEVAKYDANGCPTAEGPWPIIPDNRRWGQMKYNLLGPEFRFSFQGKNLDKPGIDETGVPYTLIYYPDPWPGKGLICLGSGEANSGGNLQIHGKTPIPSGLPMPGDGNFSPVKDSKSGAVGAKIWLALSKDVQCAAAKLDEEGNPVVDEVTGEPVIVPGEMIGWNPASYLFEGNLIVYQYSEVLADQEEEAEEASGEDSQVGQPQEPEEESTSTSASQSGSDNQGNGNANGKDKKK